MYFDNLALALHASVAMNYLRLFLLLLLALILSLC